MIRRVTNAAELNPVWFHPSVHPHILDDFSQDAEPMPELVNPPLVCLMTAKNDAFTIFVPQRLVMWEVHGAVIDSSRHMSLSYFQEMLLWMKANTVCRTVLSFVPKGNFRAYALDRAAGFKKVGVVPKCNPASGVLSDMTLMALSMEN